MPWGKHRNRPIDEIESSYLAWALENAARLDATLRTAIRLELARRFSPPPSPPSSNHWRAACPDARLATDIVALGFKQLAKRLHPDVGGNTRTMQVLNAAAEWLKAQVPQ
jgi:hypothetical protein